MRKVCLLCTLLLATGMVLAQTTATKSQSAQGPMVPTTAYRTGAQGFIGDGDALGVAARPSAPRATSPARGRARAVPRSGIFTTI
jgi:hypothetical protein